MSDKTEPATEKKLDDARKKGQVPQSRDLSSSFAFVFAIGALAATGPGSMEHVRSIIRTSLGANPGQPEQALQWLLACAYAMATDALWIVVPVIVAAMLGGVIGGLAHVGVVLSFEPLMPKFDKLDPIGGFKRLFSMKSLVEVLKTIVKAVVIGWILYSLILDVIPLMVRSTFGTANGIGISAWNALIHLFYVCAVLFCLLGVVDFVIQKLMFNKDQKMTKDEVKREYKQSEGDPQMKGQRKAIAQEAAFSAPAAAVAGANAVVVNPTHYAVALRYEPQEYGLPVVVAKGVDEQAAVIRELAKAHGVPIIGNPELARSLYKLPTPAAVPEPLLEAVAIVLRWAEQIRCEEAAC